MALTELTLKNLKPKDKRYVLGDGQWLCLEVMPTGGKFWRLRYWEGKKEHKLTLGEYPLVSLREARLKRDAIRVDRAHGVSPRTQEKISLSFEAVAMEWHEKQVLPPPRFLVCLCPVSFIVPRVGGLSSAGILWFPLPGPIDSPSVISV